MKKSMLFFLCFLFLVGCRNVPTNTYTYPISYMVEKENMFDYQPGYECAAFASSYLLRHYGEDIHGLALFESFPDKLSNNSGVYPSGISKEFQNRGYQAELIEGERIEDLKQEISKGNPVIVFIFTDENPQSIHDTHYVPIVGYDEEYFYFAESLEDKANCKEEVDKAYNRKTDLQTFEKLWSNVEGSYEHPYYRIEK